MINSKDSVAGFTTIIIGIGVAVLFLIFINYMAGQTYSLTLPDLNEITYPLDDYANASLSAQAFTDVPKDMSVVQYDRNPSACSDVTIWVTVP